MINMEHTIVRRHLWLVPDGTTQRQAQDVLDAAAHDQFVTNTVHDLIKTPPTDPIFAENKQALTDYLFGAYDLPRTLHNAVISQNQTRIWRRDAAKSHGEA